MGEGQQSVGCSSASSEVSSSHVPVSSFRRGVNEGLTPRAHSVRGVGATLAFKKTWACKDVLKAASWKTNTVFTSFYLNDVAYELDDIKSLGPFVAGGQILGDNASNS